MLSLSDVRTRKTVMKWSDEKIADYRQKLLKARERAQEEYNFEEARLLAAGLIKVEDELIDRLRSYHILDTLHHATCTFTRAYFSSFRNPR